MKMRRVGEGGGAEAATAVTYASVVGWSKYIFVETPMRRAGSLGVLMAGGGGGGVDVFRGGGWGGESWGGKSDGININILGREIGFRSPMRHRLEPTKDTQSS